MDFTPIFTKFGLFYYLLLGSKDLGFMYLES